MTTDILAKEILDKEAHLWKKRAYLRVSDNNNIILLNDLQRLHGITFLPTAKDNSDAALNNLRIMLKQNQIIINPRCKTLIRHLRNAKWNKTRTSFARTKEDGHYDALAALKYLCRNVQFYKNPFPHDYELRNKGSLFMVKEQISTKYSKFKDIFKVRKSTGD
jgi:uncharacterized protein with NRDE domain